MDQNPNPFIFKKCGETMKTLLSVLLFLLYISYGTNTQAADLLEVYRLAHCNDPILDAAKEAQLAARENTPLARANFLPIISSQATFQANNQKLENVNISNSSNGGNGSNPEIIFPQTRHFNQNTYQLTLVQPIPYYVEWIQYSKASSQVKAANATYAAAEQDLIVRTINQYFEILKAYDQLKFSTANRKAYDKIFDQTQEKFKAGLIPVTDSDLARARRDSAIADEIEAETNVLNQKEILRQITIVPIENYAFLREDLPLKPPTPALPEQWVKAAIDQNNVLLAARYGTEVARKDVNIHQAAHLPSVSINANGTRFTAIPGVTSAGTNKYANVQINIPIFNGGSITAKTRQAAHLYGQNQKLTEVLCRQTESQTRQYYRGVITQIDQIKAYKQSIVSNTSALKATETSFNVGTRTIVDVLNAQRDLIQAQQNYADARYAYIIQSILLKQSAGTLTPNDVRHINSWLTD